MSEIDNTAVDAFILQALPATYGSMCRRAPEGWDRPIDRRLQALRKKGRIHFARIGRETIWNLSEDQPA